MKTSLLLVAFAFAGLTVTSCGTNEPAETTGNTVTEDMVDGADGGLDSLNLPEENADSTGQGTTL